MASQLLYTNNHVFHNATNTAFRDWGSGIANGFNDAGWVQVTATGQVDWSTVSVNASATTSWGFEIWRMNDSLQATSPVYLRIDYGSGSAVNTPRAWLQLGSGVSDNVLTGIISGQLPCSPTANSGANTWGTFYCGSNGHIAYCGAPQSANGWAFGIERTHDAAGADTGEGVLLLGTTGSAAWYQQYWNCKTGPTANDNSLGAYMPPQGYGATGDTVTVYPIYLQRGSFTNPSLNYMVAFVQSVTGYTTLQIPLYGNTHTYLALTSMGPGTVTRSSTNTALLMRWE